MLATLRRTRTDPQAGFSLVELLVVLAILGIITAIAVPSFVAQRRATADAAVQGDMQAMYTAAASYRAANNRVTADLRTFTTGGLATPDISTDATFTIQVDTSAGRTGGFLIYGQAEISDVQWVLSSWRGKATTEVDKTGAEELMVPEGASFTTLTVGG